VITRFRKIKRREFNNIRKTEELTTELKGNNKRIKSKKEFLRKRGWSKVRTERVIGKILSKIAHGVAGRADVSNVLFFFFRFYRIRTKAVSV
jgi:hypothetical protein